MYILCQVFQVEVIHFIHISLLFLLFVYTRYQDYKKYTKKKREFQIKTEIFFTLLVEYQYNDKTILFLCFIKLKF